MSEPQLLSAWAGHWTGDGTGVTVILPPPGTVGSGEVRGGAPALREFELLDPVRLVDRVDAVVLSGGSAYGLAAGDGVMRLLRERGLGLPTPAGVVPIVVGLSLFDAAVVNPPPYAEAGRSAAEAALSGEPFTAGRVGAGTGATTGKWRGELVPSGLGVARGQAGAASVVAVIAVNAWGDVIGPGAEPVTGVTPAPPPFPSANTTIGVVLTDAKLGKKDCNLLAQSAHTGYARALDPAHTSYDGDAVVALATGEVEADLEHLRMVTAHVVAEAIRSASAPA
ncbi:P1 family peptidase [Actinoplanes lichenicola]|uniref:P1 family peptidase n=1 Tax=Paractinoplanes lichenicola TaxID=2802976 RepID=A0ABS1W639_9ACTN|nr:P1 family peptidase [Actinoplanes lichenicola]